MSRPRESWPTRVCRNMKTKPCTYGIVLGLILCLVVFVGLGIWSSDTAEKSGDETTPAQWLYNKAVATTMRMPAKFQDDTTVVCVVACGGGKLDETLVMIKSALVFAQKPLWFVVLTEYKLIPAFHEKLDEWRHTSGKTFDFTVRPVKYPSYVNETEWKKIFKECASLRLFLPDILNDTDAVLYMDTDTVFLSRPETLWNYFNDFNSSQYAALVPECEDANVCWYPRFAKHPYVPPMGVNSGVMLMNLTRMREFKWTNMVVPIYYKFKTHITWGDQDIINIIFAYKPEALFTLDCRFNYRPDHCMYMPVCKPAVETGAHVLHGSRGVFQNQKQPPFFGVYEAMQRYHFTEHPYSLLYDIKKSITTENKTGCGKSFRQFWNRPEHNLGRSNYSREYLGEYFKDEEKEKSSKGF